MRQVMVNKFIRWPEVKAKGVPISQDQAKRNARKGYFPKHRKLGGPRSISWWIDSEIDQYLADPEAFAAANAKLRTSEAA
jgi:predicted DNA-binding transcriptional regulator AlpA